MIIIDFYVQPRGTLVGFHSSGHAGYAQQGSDVVCAAVSSAIYMAVNTVTDVLMVSPEILQVNDGMLDFKVPAENADACNTVMMGLKLHLIGLEEQYENCMRISYMEV